MVFQKWRRKSRDERTENGAPTTIYTDTLGFLERRHARKLRRRFNNPRARHIRLWEYSSWGDNVYFSDYKRRELLGWLTPLPNKGDIIYAKMTTGEIGVFVIKRVETIFEVRDAFMNITLIDNLLFTVMLLRARYLHQLLQ